MDTKERATKTLNTPNDFVVVVKTYATAREFEQIQQCYMEGANMKLVGKTPTIDNFDPKSEFEAQKKTIEMLVVSINESAENVVTRMLDDMPKEDYDFVMDALDDLSGKKKALESQEQ
jgi:hypothetical protein